MRLQLVLLSVLSHIELATLCYGNGVRSSLYSDKFIQCFPTRARVFSHCERARAVAIQGSVPTRAQTFRDDVLEIMQAHAGT